MNFKLRINKILESGLWWQFLLFTVINIFVFLACMVIYHLSGRDTKVGLWAALRLFVDSNSIIDHTDSFTGQNISLLFLECMGTILFSGLIVSIITNVISQNVDAIQEGKVHYKLKDHIVIIGYDDVVPSIMKEIINDNKYKNSKIVLQTNAPVSEIRNTLLSKLSKVDLKRIVIYYAPRQSVEELQHLCTVDAKEVFIVGEREQSDHDAENMRTFEELVMRHKQKSQQYPIPLTIWFENEASYAALQLNDISVEWKKYFEFKPYNFYKRWANRLLVNSNYGTENRRIVYPELDHDGINADSNKHVHLIIVGMNRMGTALAKEAAHLLHFPNFNEKTGANRTRITFIDDNADREMNFFMGRLPGYFNIVSPVYYDLTNDKAVICKYSQNQSSFLDVQFEFIKGRVESDSVRNWIREELKDENAIISIAICISNPSQSLGMALYLPDEVYTRGRMALNKPWEVMENDQIVNVFVRQEKTGALIKAFADAAKSDSADNRRYANLYPFGMIDESFSLNYYSNHLAMAFHYIYSYYFKYNKCLPSSIPDVDGLTEIWKELSTALQWSNLYLADSIEFKLRSVGLNFDTAKYAEISDAQIEDLAYTEHSRWNMEKLLLGYRALKTDETLLNKDKQKVLKNKLYAHPLIKPYSKLTSEDKELDRNIIKKLPDILRMLN